MSEFIGMTEVVRLEELGNSGCLCAIDKTTVEVVIKALEEDLLGAEIEVLDNEGNKVTVKPVDIAAGDTTVFFEFADKIEKQEGVWTIAGHEYDFDLAANLKAFEEADTQIKFSKALADLGIENVKVENIPVYFGKNGAIKEAFLDKLAEEEKELTVEAIQAWIDEVNTKALSNEESKAIAKKVNDAIEAGNDVALLAALHDEAFVRVNPEWLGDYKTAISGITEATDKDTVEEIQALINDVNNGTGTGKVNTAIIQIENNVDKEELLEIKDLIEKYATPDEKGEQTKVTKDALKNIDIQLAVIDVKEATTPTTLKAKLTALATLVDDTEQLDIKDYKDENGKYYINGIEKNGLAPSQPSEAVDGIKDNDTIKSVAEIKGVIDAVNTAVTNAEDAISGRISNVTVGVVDKEHTGKTSGKTWLLGYSVGINLANEQGFKNAESVVAELYKGKELLGKMELRDPKKHTGNVISGTIDVYGDYVSTSWAHEWNGKLTDRPDNAKVTVKFADGVAVKEESISIADQSMQPFYRELINRAETAEEINSALLKLTEIGNDGYLNVPKADRMFLAEKVLAARNDKDSNKGKFADYTALSTALTSAISTRDEALKGINNLTAEKKIADVIEALEAVDPEGFAKMSVADKAEIAEAFFLSLEFVEVEGEEGTVTTELKTPFRTLAAVKAAAGL
jgi:hypothetical protein